MVSVGRFRPTRRLLTVKHFLVTIILLCAALAGVAQSSDPDTDESTFTNAILRTGPDPWVIEWQGFYYFTCSNGHNLRLWKTKDMTDLRHAQRRVVWRPPADTDYSEQLWAPELHRLYDKWYLYFAADDGENRHHHIYVLENANDDPIGGDWTFKGMVTDPSLRWAIDPSILSLNGKDYMLWSGWPDTKNVVENLYIAELSNPWTVKGHRSLISAPQRDWEKHVEIADPTVDIPRHGVNEGPEILMHNGTVYLVYSASGCWTDHYALGMLTLKTGKDPMKRKSWMKGSDALLTSDPDGGTYGPGHNSFFTSPDGKENWILYHANEKPDQGCRDNRSLRAQPFQWDPSGAPVFGRPVPLGEPLAKPSGTALEKGDATNAN